MCIAMKEIKRKKVLPDRSNWVTGNIQLELHQYFIEPKHKIW